VPLPATSPDAAFDRSLTAVADISAATDRTWAVVASGALYVIEHDHRDALMLYLREHDIFTQVHYIPAHLMPYYADQGNQPGDFPNAEDYYSRCLSLPMYPSLTDEQQQFVIDKILSFNP
jgi:dTDP-4-amino-4,6-dideoxygalactose transaminase